MIGNLLRSRTVERSEITLPDRMLLNQPAFGPMNVNRDTMLSHVVANRCVQFIANQLGSMPLTVERNGETIPTPTVLQRPEPGMTRADFMSALTVSMLVHGNAYAYISQRDSLGHPLSLVLLDPQAVSVTTQAGRPQYRIAGRLVDADDLLHARNLVLPGHAVGVGPLDLNRQSIGQALAADQYAANSYTTGSLPDGVLQSDAELTAEQSAELKQAFIAGNGGRSRGPAVLSGGVVYKPMQFSSADMEVLDGRRFNALQICTLFGVPPFLIGVPSADSKTYSNVQQDAAAFSRFSLRPLAVKIEQALADLLPRGQHVTFNMDALLRAATVERYTAHEIGLRAGFLTVEEVRAMEGLGE